MFAISSLTRYIFLPSLLAEEHGDGMEIPPPPDSWESADIDERVKVLSINASVAKEALAAKEKNAEADGKKEGQSEAASSTELSAMSRQGCVTTVFHSEEELARVDTFLREALQNPRDRIMSTYLLDMNMHTVVDRCPQ